jgi:hypothetical protein
LTYLVLLTLVVTYGVGATEKQKNYHYYHDMRTCLEVLGVTIKNLSPQENVTINTASCEETNYREGEVPN